MKIKWLLPLVIALLTVVFGASAVMAAKGDNPANDKSAGNGNSNVASLYLYEKDASWNIVWGGGEGKLTFNLAGSTFNFGFNGHGLQANTAYSLIVYDEPWPGNNPGALLASGTSNGGGNIHLAGSVDLGRDLSGAKIWLVTSSDYDGAKMTGWNPGNYLFEHNLISYDDTDVP